MRPTMYVNQAGVADNAPPYVRDAIDKLKGRAAAAGTTRAGTSPGAAAPAVNDVAARPGILGRARAALGGGAAPAAAPGAAPAAAGSRIPGILKRVGGAAAGALGAGQALYGGAQIAGGDTVGGVENAALGTLTAAPPTRGVGILGNVLKAGRDAVLPAAANLYADLTDKGSGDLVGPELEKTLAGRTPEEFLIETGRRPDPIAVPEAVPPPGQPTAEPTQADLSAQIDDPAFIPAQGTGLIRNERTRRVAEVGGQPGQPVETAVAEPTLGAATPASPVQFPDLSLALSSGTLPEFLRQYGRAAQGIAANKTAASSESGILKRAKTRQDLELGETELKGAERLDSIMEELTSLDDSTDPGGARRLKLRNLALTLGGKTESTSDTPEDRHERALIKQAYGELQSPEQRTEADAWIQEQMKTYRERRGGGTAAAQTATNPQTGEKMRWDGKQWVAA